MAIEPFWWDAFNAAQLASDLDDDYTFSAGESVQDIDGRRAVRMNRGLGNPHRTMRTEFTGGGLHYVVAARSRLGGDSGSSTHFAEAPILSFLETATRRVEFRSASTNGDVDIRLDGTIVDTNSSVVLQGDEFQYFELEVYIHATNGFIRAYIDRELVCEFDGDTTAAASINVAEFHTWVATSAGFSHYTYFTDLYIAQVTGADEGTDGNVLGPVTCPELPVDSDGSIDFTLSTGADAFALLDDVPNDDDSTYVESGVEDAEDVLGIDASGLEDGPIIGVGVVSTSRQANDGFLKLRHGLTSGATTEYTDAFTVGSTYRTRMRGLWLADPDDDGEWTDSKLAALNLRYQNRAS